jgi:hypothetical protein
VTSPEAGRGRAVGFGLLVLTVAVYGLVASAGDSGGDSAGGLYAGTVSLFAQAGRARVCHTPFDACLENGPVVEGLSAEGLPELDLDAPDETDDPPPSKQGVPLRLTVRFDGERLVLAEAPAEPVNNGERVHFGSACPEPAGGWTTSDPDRTRSSDVSALEAHLAAQDDLARVWWDTDAAPGRGVLNVAFTGDLDRHRAELAEIWGGPLCVSTGTRRLADLRSAARRMSALAESLPGAEGQPPRLATCCGVDRERGAVSLFSVIHDPLIDDWIERWSDGVPVHVDAYLEPVGGS